MKKLKTQKGITLVALIITIVVLLILAVVAIGSLRESEIIQYAKKAAIDYETKQEEEKGLIEGYKVLISEQQGSSFTKWELQEDGVTIKNGKTQIKIGDEIENDAVLEAKGGTKGTYTGTWTVLGAENGKLKLVSTTNVVENVILGKEDPKVPAELEEIYKEENLDLEKAIWSYLHVTETLDKYAKTATGITSARSINIEDIEAEKVLDITETKKQNELESSYGKTYIYSYNDGKTGAYVNKEGKVIVIDSDGDNVTIDSNFYTYSDAFATTPFNSFLGNGSYWVVSQCVFCYKYGSDFGVRYVENGDILNRNLFYSYGAKEGDCLDGVRAVVYI